MPWSPQRIPALRHHRPSGQAVVTLDGKDHYLGKWNDPASKEQYDRLVQQWLANARRLPDKEPAPFIIAELFLAYLEHAEQYYVKNSQQTSEVGALRSAMQAVEGLYARLPASEFRPLALKQVQQAMIDQGMCRGTINRHVGRIKRIFKWATENELIPPTAYQALQAVSGLRRNRTAARESLPVKPAPEAHIAAVERWVSREVWGMIQMQLVTGMRPGEVTIMRGCDLETSGDTWLYTPSTHKTENHGHERPIYLGPKAQAVVKQFLKSDLGAFLFDPRDAETARHVEQRKNRKSPMTPSQAKRRPKRKPKVSPQDHYSVDSYRRAIARACDQANEWERGGLVVGNDECMVARWHPHQLRHNAATRLRKEFGIDAARVVLGHRSAAVTEIYAEIDHLKAAEVMAKVG